MAAIRAPLQQARAVSNGFVGWEAPLLRDPASGPALTSHMCMSSHCHTAPESGYYQPLSDEESEVQKGLATCPRAVVRQEEWPGLSPGLWTADPTLGPMPPGHRERGALPSTQSLGTNQLCGPQGYDSLTFPLHSLSQKCPLSGNSLSTQKPHLEDEG